MARLPKDLPDLAAMVVAQPLATVLRAMVRTGPVINQRCAVLGVGSMGLIFTHLLRRMGAAQVIAIDRVPWRLRWATRLGATAVIDASRENVIEAVRALTGGAMVDLCVEAVGHPEALDVAAHLPRRKGRLYVFGVPHQESQPFPWYFTLGNETEMIASMGPECMEYFQTAANMLVEGHADLTSIVTPRLPWESAAEAFEMYANPGPVEDALKITLVL
jgi:S-(hydroxymethyl)mycothiol dehydrogenase